MQTKTLALATALTFALSGMALAQTPSGGGNTEGNMNNPGSVKSNSEKGMERSTGSATGGSTGPAGTGMAPAVPGAAGESTVQGTGTGTGASGAPGAPGGR